MAEIFKPNNENSLARRMGELITGCLSIAAVIIYILRISDYSNFTTEGILLPLIFPLAAITYTLLNFQQNRLGIKKFRAIFFAGNMICLILLVYLGMCCFSMDLKYKIRKIETRELYRELTRRNEPLYSTLHKFDLILEKNDYDEKKLDSYDFGDENISKNILLTEEARNRVFRLINRGSFISWQKDTFIRVVKYEMASALQEAYKGEKIIARDKFNKIIDVISKTMESNYSDGYMKIELGNLAADFYINNSAIFEIDSQFMTININRMIRILNYVCSVDINNRFRIEGIRNSYKLSKKYWIISQFPFYAISDTEKELKKYYSKVGEITIMDYFGGEKELTQYRNSYKADRNFGYFNFLGKFLLSDFIHEDAGETNKYFYNIYLEKEKVLSKLSVIKYIINNDISKINEIPFMDRLSGEKYIIKNDGKIFYVSSALKQNNEKILILNIK